MVRVWDRIQEIADFPESQLSRPTSPMYPLMLPGVASGLRRLMENVGSEIHVLYHALEGSKRWLVDRSSVDSRSEGGALPIQPGRRNLWQSYPIMRKDCLCTRCTYY